MKKLLVLAMVLVFAAMPVFSELTISGEFDYYMVNGFDDSDSAEFADKWDKGEVDIKGAIGDYTKMAIEIEEDGSWNKSEGTKGEGTPSFNYFRVISDWGKFFGLEGIGITTDIGLNSWETFDNVSFTGFAYEYSDDIDNPATKKDFGGKLNLSFADGLVQPYAALNFDTTDAGVKDSKPYDNDAQYLLGVGLDFAAMELPLWVEGYFFKEAGEDVNMFGVEAMYELAIADYLFTIGGHIISEDNGDDRGQWWGAGVAFEAFGAKIGVSAAGAFGDDYWDAKNGKDAYAAFSAMGIDAEYFFLDWLGVNAGAQFAFGDYKEVAGDEAFQSFEVGIVAKPEKGVCYKLGYIYANDDAVSALAGAPDGATTFFKTLNTDGVTAAEGGLYFVTKIDF